MNTWVALLRGVNVGGHRKIAMAELRGFLEELGFAGVRTLLQSGNAVFRGRAHTAAKLEAMLEKEAAARLAIETQFFVRTSDEWNAIVRANPFPEWAQRDPAHLHVACLKQAVSADAVRALQRAIRGRELAAGSGREIFLVYPDGMGTSALTNAVIERALGASFTARNWNTVTKLAAAMAL